MIARALYLIARLAGRPLALIALLSAAVIAAARLYAHYLGHAPTVADARRANLTITAILAAAAAAWLIRRGSRWLPRVSPFRAHPMSLGSARWGSSRHLESPHGFPRGFIVGRSGRWHRPPLLRYTGDAHILTLAPTGAGKGVSCVIPTLLDYPGSVLVIDPKGENYAVTADYRRSIGHEVVALDPFGLVGGTGSFNPMDSLDVADSLCADDAAALAEMLVVRDPHASGDTMFWSEEAKALLAGLMLLVAESGGMHTLATVWEILSVPPRDLTKLWRMMSASTGADGAIQRAGHRVMQKADRVRSSVIAEAQSHLHFIESSRLATVLSTSSFSFSGLKTSRMTIYLIVPPDRIDTCRRWLRLMVASALDALIRTPGLPADRVLFLLDEFPALGPMPPLERAATLARGYGATCWFLAQSLSQLRALYPESWASFVANAGLVQAFGTSDLETATYLSAMLGTATARVPGTSRSERSGAGALFHGRDARTSHSESEHGRPLLSPGEVRRLDPGSALLLMPGKDPLRVSRPDYRHDREFRHRFAPNPMHESVALAGH